MLFRTELNLKGMSVAGVQPRVSQFVRLNLESGSSPYEELDKPARKGLLSVAASEASMARKRAILVIAMVFCVAVCFYTFVIFNRNFGSKPPPSSIYFDPTYLYSVRDASPPVRSAHDVPASASTLENGEAGGKYQAGSAVAASSSVEHQPHRPPVLLETEVNVMASPRPLLRDRSSVRISNRGSKPRLSVSEAISQSSARGTGADTATLPTSPISRAGRMVHIARPSPSSLTSLGVNNNNRERRRLRHAVAMQTIGGVEAVRRSGDVERVLVSPTYEGAFSIWHISDIHAEAQYDGKVDPMGGSGGSGRRKSECRQPTAVTRADDPRCKESPGSVTNNNGGNTNSNTTPWSWDELTALRPPLGTPHALGRSMCDPPITALKAALTQMHANMADPAAIVVSGDLISHKQSCPVVQSRTRIAVAKMIRARFPRSLVLFAFGNNDYTLKDVVTAQDHSLMMNELGQYFDMKSYDIPSSSDTSTLSPTSSTTSMMNNEQDAPLNGDIYSAALEGGSYARTLVRDNISVRFVVLNLLLLTKESLENSALDPLRNALWAFAETEVNRAITTGQRIILVSHNPFGAKSELDETAQAKMLQILAPAVDLIIVHLAGDLSRNEVRAVPLPSADADERARQLNLHPEMRIQEMIGWTPTLIFPSSNGTIPSFRSWEEGARSGAHAGAICTLVSGGLTPRKGGGLAIRRLDLGPVMAHVKQGNGGNRERRHVPGLIDWVDYALPVYQHSTLMSARTQWKVTFGFRQQSGQTDASCPAIADYLRSLVSDYDNFALASPLLPNALTTSSSSSRGITSRTSSSSNTRDDSLRRIALSGGSLGLFAAGAPLWPAHGDVYDTTDTFSLLMLQSAAGIGIYLGESETHHEQLSEAQQQVMARLGKDILDKQRTYMLNWTPLAQVPRGFEPRLRCALTAVSHSEYRRCKKGLKRLRKALRKLKKKEKKRRRRSV